MAVAGGLPVPAPMNCKGDIPANWAFFREQWENYEVAADLIEKDDAVRSATLKTVMGRECYDVLRHLSMEEGDRKKPTVILDKLHFTPKKNTINKRFVFGNSQQRPGQSTEEFIAELRRLASSCNFGQLRGELIPDRLVIGIADKIVQAQMLRERDLTLEKAEDMCRASELTRRQMLQLAENGLKHSQTDSQKNDEVPTNFIRRAEATQKLATGMERKVRKPRVSAAACHYCGTNHPKDREQCPAFGVTCKACGRRNHFARVCKASGASAEKKIRVSYMKLVVQLRQL